MREALQQSGVENGPQSACGADIALAAKVAFLRRPDAYRDPPRRVETVETHMAWVFLTENHAYKLKKPVRYDYLDFSTLEARALSCADEVRLNRRLSRGVYLGVVPLTCKADGRLALGGAGEPVDWLVWMRRLPYQRQLDRAIACGTVRPSDLARVGRLLARFYRSAAVERVSPAAYRARFAADIAANRTELTQPRYQLPVLPIKQTAATLLGYLRHNPETFDLRIRLGRIVEAHGDLRPEHIFLGARPQIIDCLEFRRDFRILDAADEVAFLAMECERLGAPAAGDAIFAAYRRDMGDAPPPALMCFYRSHRALTRAKIAIWHLRDEDVREPEKWRARARAYLALASRYAARFR
jgi:aminoglycoside phosphotransferase family enzyme